MIISIAAAGINNVIGEDNKLLWHLPDDFKRFKELTSGHYIIMGRKTFESFPKPLPNRTHVIITRDKNYLAEGCIIVNSLQEAFDVCPKDENCFVIGGGEIYKQSMDYIDVIELTKVNCNLDGDTFFPEIDLNKWYLFNNITHPADDKHKYDFEYLTYKKREV